MGPITVVEVVTAAWMLTASLVLIFMVRRGHSPSRWTAIAFLTGPIALVLAMRARRRSGRVAASVLRWGGQGPGPLSVLVGVDGSVMARDALEAAVDTLGPRIGRLTLAYVADFEAAASESNSDRRAHAEQMLNDQAEAVKLRLRLDPRTILLAGPPARALVQHAASAGDDLIVIGVRGRGDAEWLEGSVAAALADEPSIRVMILGGRVAGRTTAG